MQGFLQRQPDALAHEYLGPVYRGGGCVPKGKRGSAGPAHPSRSGVDSAPIYTRPRQPPLPRHERGRSPSMTLPAALTLIVATLVGAPEPLTVAEASDFRATSTYAEVMQFCEALDEASELVHLESMGRSAEGKSLPLMIIADPPVTSPLDARASGKLVIFLLNNIHAGEVCGKEASLMLARDLALTPHAPKNASMLSRIVFVIAPIYNADGNDRMSPNNRPGQLGPELGMGERANSQGLDLNRDHVKLESPEARALVSQLNRWDPHLTIDTHTTNGTRYRYQLTYAEPMHPSGAEEPREFLRTEMLPEVSRRMLERTGRATFFYGNFNREHTAWTTYSCMPRFGTQYRGLRGRMSILSEGYAHVLYKDRVLATYEFLRECALYSAEHASRMQRIHRNADLGDGLPPGRMVGIRHEMAAYKDPVVVAGYKLRRSAGGVVDVLDEPAEVTVQHFGRFVATTSVEAPFAYLIPPGHDAVVENLHRHGVLVDPVIRLHTVDVEVARIRSVAFRDPPFQGHRMATLDVNWRSERRAIGPGWHRVEVGGRLAPFTVSLLEPESEDGLAAWNFFDGGLREGAEFPVLRVPLQPE